jgi:serine/threonine protein kinase
MMSAEAPIGVIAHYNLLERLEPAGPGDLFRARDTRAGRTVVVRLLPATFPGAAAVLDQARALFALSHPNAVAVFDAGEHDGRVFVVYEHLKGQSLRAELGGRPIGVRRAVDLAAQVAGVLADCRAADIPCPGVSPDAIVVTAKGLAKVPVFALASSVGFAGVDPPVRLHHYDSPEEARGEPADERSETYAVGAVLFEMLTGRRPSPRGAAAPSASNPAVPPALDAVALKAVAPNPDRRYQSTVTLAAELRALDLEGRAEPAARPAAAAGPRERTPSSRLLVIGVAALLVAAAAWCARAGG